MRIFREMMISYYWSLYDSCLDEDVKEKIMRKIEYHERRMLEERGGRR